MKVHGLLVLISRLKQQWLEEQKQCDCSIRNLSDTHYLYFLADGIDSPVRQDNRLCLLFIIGILSMNVRSSLCSKILIESQKQTRQNFSIACKHTCLNRISQA
ncbi:MAG: hypothetical protein ACTS73_03720 [Arsenophonus sp. NEOnobi-MAG3]